MSKVIRLSFRVEEQDEIDKIVNMTPRDRTIALTEHHNRIIELSKQLDLLASGALSYIDKISLDDGTEICPDHTLRFIAITSKELAEESKDDLRYSIKNELLEKFFQYARPMINYYGTTGTIDDFFLDNMIILAERIMEINRSEIDGNNKFVITRG